MATVGRLAIVLTASATDFERAMGRAARAVKSTEKEFNQSARRMQDIGKKWSLGVTAPIVAALTVVSKAAIAWEDAFADAQVTIEGTAEQIENLDRALRKMTERMPLTHQELAGIAGMAGRFGIQADRIADFTETIAKLGSVAKVDLVSVATGIAQIDNIMGTGQKAFENYGSAVLALGSALPVTEQDIVDFALRIAGAGRIAGLTADQVLAVAGSFTSFGVKSEVGGTAVSKVLAKVSEAVATGNDHLRVFAAVSGMSAQEFRKAWRDDAGEVFVRFVEGLGKSGDQAYAILRELGLSDQRLVRAFITVGQAEGFLRNAMSLGAKTWEEAIYLTEKADMRYKTVANRFKMLRNRIKNVGITIGETLLPLINAVVGTAEKLSDGLARMAENWAKLPAPIRSTVINVLLLFAAIGPAIFALGLLNRTIAGAIGVTATFLAFSSNAVFAFNSWRGGAATLGEALAYLAGGKIKLVILAISSLVVISVLLAANWDKVRAVAQRVWGAISAVVLTAGSLIVRAVGWIMTAVSWLVPGLKGAAQAVIGLADAMKGATSRAIQSAQDTAAVAEQAADVADTANKAADSQNNLADSFKSAAKAAKNNIQSFDEVHLLQTDMAEQDFGDLDLGFGDDYAIPTLQMPNIADGLAGIGDTLSGIAEKASVAFTTVAQAMTPMNNAVQWIKDNWPTIGPIVETIATIITVLLLPAIINTGIQALIAGGKVLASWAMQSAAAITHGATILGQFALQLGKWALLGLQALVNAGKVVLAWAMQGWEAVASVAVQIGQFLLVGAKWVWLGILAVAEAGKVVLAWIMQQSQAVASVAIQIAQFVLLGAKWVWLGILAVVEAGKVVVAWVMQQTQAVASVAVQIAQFILLGAKWVWMGIVATANAAVMAAAWLVSIAPIALVVAAVVGLAVVIWQNWDSIKTWTVETWGKVADFLTRTWEGIKKTAGEVWDGILGTIKGVINGIIKAVNWMIRGLNKLQISAPDWLRYVPGLSGLAGKTWGINISEIPLLRTGTNYVPQDMLAYLHQGEAVVPREFNPAAGGGNADDIAQAVYRAVLDAYRMLSATSGSKQQGDLVMQVREKELGRIALAAIQNEADRTGQSFVIRPQRA
jgi:TP901 family phage tail tape measure protein